MKLIFKVAKAELRNLFYSPIAWLIILVFYIVCGYQFVNPLVDIARVQEANIESGAAWNGFSSALSVSVFTQSLKNILENFYLFIPLLTMGVINREVNSGTMKLLYSSPIRTRDIVFGKYLGLLIFSLVLLTIVAILFTTGYFTIIHAEYKWYLAILLALFLLVSAYIAIGLFLSSLTTYQVVAGILTFLMFFILQALRNVWQQYDFFRDITYFLAMTNKAEYMIRGSITTRDVLYFIIIIAMFLSFTLIKLKSTQESKSWKVSLTRYLVVSIVSLTLGYFSSRPGYVGYLDVTRGKLNSLHPATQAVLKEMDGSPLTVTLYTNLLGRNPGHGLPQFRNAYVWDYWEKVVQYYPNIKYKYEYYYDVNEHNKQIVEAFPTKSIEEVAASVAELVGADISQFKKPEEIRKIIDLKDEDHGLTMELEYKGKKTLLRTYPDPKVMPDQVHVSGSVRRLVRDTTPTITFTTGHFERSPYRNGEREYGYNTNYKGSRLALINLGVNVDTLSLKNNDISATTNVLVVADPKAELEQTEKDKIIRYLNEGGNAIFYGEPGKQDVLNPILQTIGVTLDKGTVVIPSKDNMPHELVAIVTNTGTKMAAEPLLYGTPDGSDGGSIYFTGGANISYQEINGFKVEPIYGITPRSDSWIETGIFVSDSARPIFSESEGDVRKQYYTGGIQLTRTINGKQQRIMVSGDADFMTPKAINGSVIGNGMFSWTLNNEYPVYTNYPEPIDRQVTIGYDTARSIYVIYVYVISSILLLFGVILLVRRKRK